MYFLHEAGAGHSNRLENTGRITPRKYSDFFPDALIRRDRGEGEFPLLYRNNFSIMKRNIFVFALILSIITFNYAGVYGDVAYQNADSLAQIRENREIKISGKIDITDIATPATEVPKFL